jgi:membrane protein
MNLKLIGSVLGQAFTNFGKDQATTLAAALAFFTIFSLAPLLVLGLYLVGAIYGQSAAQSELLQSLGPFIGPSNTETLANILEKAPHPKGNILATMVGFFLIFAGATAVFAQLKIGLNRIWGVLEFQQNIEGNFFTFAWEFIRTRVLAVVMILIIGFLILISVLASAVISAVQTTFDPYFPDFSMLWNILDFLASFLLITLLFGLILKLLPDAHIRWRDVWVGAAISALLFVIGKTLLGVYFGSANFLTAYGAAGKVIALLVWVFFSAQIFYLGAELTQSYTAQVGSGITPARRPGLVKKFIPSKKRDKQKNDQRTKPSKGLDNDDARQE